jgi:hypothetical protein
VLNTIRSSQVTMWVHIADIWQNLSQSRSVILMLFLYRFRIHVCMHERVYWVHILPWILLPMTFDSVTSRIVLHCIRLLPALWTYMLDGHCTTHVYRNCMQPQICLASAFLRMSTIHWSTGVSRIFYWGCTSLDTWGRLRALDALALPRTVYIRPFWGGCGRDRHLSRAVRQ